VGVVDVESELDDVATCFEAVAAAAEEPGISVATRPPKTAAVTAAPPVAMTVSRLTLRSAAVRWSGAAWRLGEPDRFSEVGGGMGYSLVSSMNDTARDWQFEAHALSPRCEFSQP